MCQLNASARYVIFAGFTYAANGTNGIISRRMIPRFRKLVTGKATYGSRLLGSVFKIENKVAALFLSEEIQRQLINSLLVFCVNCRQRLLKKDNIRVVNNWLTV